MTIFEKIIIFYKGIQRTIILARNSSDYCDFLCYILIRQDSESYLYDLCHLHGFFLAAQLNLMAKQIQILCNRLLLMLMVKNVVFLNAIGKYQTSTQV